MTDARWTLWVFAGPGALSGPTFGTEPVLLESPVGEPIPLSDVLARLLGDQGKLPAGVKLVAETVGEPTVLQQLTGEWPTQRLVGEPGMPLGVVGSSPAERDLGRFLAWAEEQTPKDSKRALIVLGDLLQAIGEAPKPLPLGGYRPGYPNQIRVKRSGSGSWLGSNTVSGSTSSSTTYSITEGTPPKTVTNDLTLANWLTNLSVGDAIDIGETPRYQKTATGYQEKTDDTLGTDQTYRTKTTPTFSYTQILTIVPNTSDITFTVVSTNPATTPAQRSVDDVGPAPVDLITRRVDALVNALTGRRVDLLVSDECDLVRIVALRRLVSNTGTLVGLQGSRACAGQPLVAMLEALAAAPEAQPEALAMALTEKYAVRASKLLDAASRSQAANDRAASATRTLMAPGHGIVALRHSGAMQLVAALDSLAGEVLAAGGSTSTLGDVASALRDGGDIAHLIDRLGTRGAAVEAGVVATIVARRVIAAASAAGRSLGIDLDGLGLQLRAVSDWTRLLDQVGGNPNVELARRTLEDVQALTCRMKRASASGPSTPLRWLEYSPAAKLDFDPATDFEAFLAGTLAQPSCCAARHLALVVRGMRAPGQPASIALAAGGSLAIVTLARCLRKQLSKQRRGPLAMIVFDDPQLLGLEIAYELRDVAYTFLTSVAGTSPPTLALFEGRVSERVVRGCERDAVDDARQSTLVSSTAALLDPWRREVARRLANQIVAPDHDADGIPDAKDRDDDADGIPDAKDQDDDADGIPDVKETAGNVALQGIDLRHMEALCRRFDRILELMLDNLDESVVLAAVKIASNARSLIELINWAQMQALLSSPAPIAREINSSFGDVYNWIAVSKWSKLQGSAAFWIDPGFVEDRNPGGYCTRLRINPEPNQPRDYRQLSFHQDVRLHALLASARLLDAGSQRLWGLISLGLAYSPSQERCGRLEKLGLDPNAGHYFRYLGAPPLLSLDLEGDGTKQGYELRLSSSESAAVLVRQRSIVNLASVERSLEGLGYVLSQSAASREGWAYLESLGANLAEDVVSNLREPIERERDVMLGRGRSREAHLALALPRELMRFPWEMMRLPSLGGQPGALLAERFAIGRQMWSDRELRRVGRDHRVRMLIVANPRTNMAPLPGAEVEGRAIQSLCAAMGGELGHGFEFDCDAVISETLTCAALRKLVREGNYDVLHYAGHASYHPSDAERSGWLLSDDLLSVTELRNTLAWTECPPWLIYANTCNGGMIDDSPASLYQGDVHGMADACIRAGVNAYVAPLWKISDESARMLATEFYRELLLARSTVGVALYRARMHVRKTWESLRGDTGLGDVSWAGMVLFGNPIDRLNDSAS